MSFRGLDFSSGINKYADLLAQSYKDRYQIEQDKIKNDILAYQANTLYGAPLPQSNPYQGPVFFQDIMPQAPLPPQIPPGEDVNFPTSMNEMGIPERMPAQNDRAEAARLQGDLARGRVGETATSRGTGITPQTAAEDLAMMEIERRKKAAQGGASESQVDQMFRTMISSNPDMVKQYGPYLNKMYLEMKQREMAADRPSGLDGLAALLRPAPVQRAASPRAPGRDPRIAAIEKQVDQLLKQIPKPPKSVDALLDPDAMVKYSAQVEPINAQIQALQNQKNKILGIVVEEPVAKTQKKIKLANGESLTEEEYAKKYPKGYKLWKSKQSK